MNLKMVTLLSKKDELLARLTKLEDMARFAETQYQAGDRDIALNEYRRTVNSALALKKEIMKMVG